MQNETADAGKKRSRRALVLRSLLPEKEVIAKEVIAKKKGETFHVARIFGYATEAVSKPTDFGDGRMTDIVSLAGTFRTDKGANYSSITLTQAFSKAMASALAAAPIIKVDANILLRNTGSAASPYEWTVFSNLDDTGLDAMAVFPAAK